MLDGELRAIRKIHTVLKDLDHSCRMRVLKYCVESLEHERMAEVKDQIKNQKQLIGAAKHGNEIGPVELKHPNTEPNMSF